MNKFALKEPTNADRAARGAVTYNHYRDAFDTDEPFDDVVTDLLADFMHMCLRFHDADKFSQLLESARNHFDCEVEEEGSPA